MSQIKSGKTWSLVARENNVRMQPISVTVRDLEKNLKKERATATTAKGSKTSTGLNSKSSN